MLAQNGARQDSNHEPAIFLPLCELDERKGSSVFYTANYSIDWAKEGVLQGVSSADFISTVDIGGRIIVLLGDVEGKGCLVPREDQGEGLSSDQRAAASSGATSASLYQNLFYSVCTENAATILSSEKPAITAVRRIFEALEKKSVAKSLDFAIVVLDVDPDRHNPQRIAHICAAGVSVFLDTNDRRTKIEPNATPFYPGIYSKEDGSRIFDNNQQHSILLSAGDRIILSSDGLDRTRDLQPYWEDVRTETPIERALQETSSQTTAAELLILAREKAGCGLDSSGSPEQCHDDTAVAVIRVMPNPNVPSL